ncbi:MAG: NAD(+) synthase [Tissierellia bacterium]|nr:NAD(+) synthase [Tissierellia bacterium]
MKLTNDNLKELSLKLNNWIKEKMIEIGGKKAVIGVSGGKDSSVTAALCVDALGPENVIGILMPDGVQNDIQDAIDLCNILGISYIEANISTITSAFLDLISNIQKDQIKNITNQTKYNLPPRVRMTLLYAISQSIDDARVINTSNLSEDWIGYATVYGDTAGAFSPLGMLTSDEVIQIGKYLGLPERFVIKNPSDGLTGRTDEDVFGFSYAVLNRYIREGICEDKAIKAKIDNMHKFSRHKFLPIKMFNPILPIAAEDIEEIYKGV